MYRGKSFVCVLPARGGSKRTPNKNIKYLAGRPLMCWVIDAAKKSGIFDKIVCSTDSDKIAEIAVASGIEIVWRPYELAMDNSPVEDAVAYTLKDLEIHGKTYDYVQLLQATTPLLIKDDILNATEILIDKNADMIISVCQSRNHLGVTKTLPPDRRMTGFLTPEMQRTRTQDVEVVFELNDAVYIGKWDIFYNKKDYYGDNAFAYVMPVDRSVDIDNPIDFELAEMILEKHYGKTRSVCETM